MSFVVPGPFVEKCRRCLTPSAREIDRQYMSYADVDLASCQAPFWSTVVALCIGRRSPHLWCEQQLEHECCCNSSVRRYSHSQISSSIDGSPLATVSMYCHT